MGRQQLQDGGTVKRENLYVERPADEEVFTTLEQGDLCFVLGPRQAGKSSLRVRVGARLAEHGVRSATIDFQRVGNDRATPESWYFGLAYEIGDQLRLRPRWEEWWHQQSLSPSQTWSAFLRKILVIEVTDPVVLFADEVDNLLSLPFSDDFLASMRAVYTDRAENPDLKRLTFCLLGSHPPARLVKDPARTPLNLGRSVLIDDFTREEIQQFLPAIQDLLPSPETVLDRTFEWTSGHPLMTQRILVALLRKERVVISRLHAEIQDVVYKSFLRAGRTDDSSLAEGARRCLTDEPEAPTLAKLHLYQQLLEFGEIDLDRRNPVQLALRLAGMAAERPTEHGSALAVRNAIFALVFDQEWVVEQRENLFERRSPTGVVHEESPASTSLESMTRTVDRMFCDPATATHGPFHRLGPGIEILAGTLFRFVLQSPHKRLSLQVFKGVGGIGGELWEQEVRALVRLSSRNHPTIPRIQQGGFEEAADFAFILTEAARYTLEEAGAIESLRRRPYESVRQLALLAEGLSLLHGNGLMHRNLGRGAIEIIEDPDESLHLRFARFEMASLVGNLLRRIVRPAGAGTIDEEQILDFFRRQSPLTLACSPPERLAFVFRVSGEDMLEGPQTDIFGLGVIAYQWLVGPLPENLLEQTFPQGGYNPERHRALITEMQQRIRREPLPASLIKLVGEKMIDPGWRTRCTADEVVRDLSKHWDEISDFWAESSNQVTHLVTYFPAETGEVLRAWSLLEHDASTPAGQEQLRAFLVEDLRNALLTFSEHGYAPYVDSPDARHYAAQCVLIGGRAAYFAAPYQHRVPWQKDSGQELPQVLIIRFVTDRKRVWRLEANTFKRRLPPVGFVPLGADELEPRNAVRHPSWEPLIRSVRPKKAPEWHLTIENALDWLLRLERVRLDARMYPVTIESDGAFSDLEIDQERDEHWIWEDSFRTLYARDERRRPHLGDFWEQLAADEGPRLLLLRDREGKPNRKDGIVLDAQFDRTLDLDRIRVKWTRPVQHLPSKGWIQPLDDAGSRIQLERQSRARFKLLEMPGLIDQLTNPAASIRLRSRWPDAGKGLSGEAPAIVREMLDSWPFFALHGPPGTGKTTVAAHAVEMSLQKDGGQRILVAAQSHYALDNLAERILNRLESGELKEVSALRIAAPGSETKVSSRMLGCLPARLTDDRIHHIERACAVRLQNAEDPPEIREIITTWKDEVSRSAIELQDRLRRGANLLFSTTGTAIDRYLGVGTYFDTCDWVIVEEAAKAWPTELAMPLVQGLRWTLIGDHLQLPAFGRAQVQALLLECASSSNDELREHGLSRERYLQVFDLFASLFRTMAAERAMVGGTDSAVKRPVRRLTMQFRMRSPIAETVSQAFYGGELKTHPSADLRDHYFKVPGWLAGESLVWVDTSSLVNAREAPLWKNVAEGEIVKRIVSVLRPEPSSEPMGQRLAILSPYLAQVRLLEDLLRASASDCVHTVDSFQGREADIVVVSLVRCNDERSLIRRLGFLAYPERINVLFSRARCLLIIVGSFEHFQATEETFWSEVCQCVLQYGKRLSAASLGLVEPGQEVQK